MFIQTLILYIMNFYDSMSTLCYTVTVYLNTEGLKRHEWKEMTGMFATDAPRKYMTTELSKLYDFEFIPLDKTVEFHTHSVLDSEQKPDFTVLLKITEIERIEVYVNQNEVKKPQ